MSRGDTQQDDGEPRVLSPEDLNRTMSLGYDAAVAAANKAKADEGLLSGKSYGRRIYDLMPSNGRTYRAPTPAGAPTGFGDTQQDDGEPSLSAGDTQQPEKPSDRMPLDESSHAEKLKDPYRDERKHADERRDEMLAWYEKQAQKLFPWASQEPQKQAFIMHGMERFFGHDLSRENSIRADRAGIAERGLQEKRLEHQGTLDARTANNERNNETKKAIAAFNQTARGQQIQQSQLASTLRTAMMAGQDMDPKGVETLRKQFEQMTGRKVDTSDPDTMKEILGLNKSIVKPQGQGQENTPVGSMQIDRATGRTRTMQADGTWKIN